MMNILKLFEWRSGWAGLLGLLVVETAWTAPATAPGYGEVSGLIRSNLAGASAEQIERAAVQGLLSAFSPRVVLVESAQKSPTDAAGQKSVLDSRIYRRNVGYVQLAKIGTNAAPELHAIYAALEASNQLSGLVLDLRGATGDDYAAALAVADLFLTREVPLINWGEGLKSSKAKANGISVPVALLVNGRTGGAAEALAGMLRQSGVALVLGQPTSGTAGTKRSFPLQNGQMLQIIVSDVQLGDARLISAAGLKPDVEVEPGRAATGVRPESGEVALAAGQVGATNQSAGPKRFRMDEADLVRRWRGEMLTADDLEEPPIKTGPEAQDPVLVRALDLMDGLAILRSW